MSYTLTVKDNDTGEVVEDVEMLAGGFYGVSTISFTDSYLSNIGAFGFRNVSEEEVMAVYVAAVKSVISTTDWQIPEDQDFVEVMCRRKAIAVSALVQMLCNSLGPKNAKGLLRLAANNAKAKAKAKEGKS